MAISNSIMRYIGNEILPAVTNNVTKGIGTSALKSLIPNVASKVGTDLATKAGTTIIDNLVPKMATSSASPDMITLFRGLTQKYDPKYPVAKLDTSGYESWTDNPELARQYGDYVYSIDVPKADIKDSYLDENPKSPTYGDRNPIYAIDKKAGLNGISGKEYLLEVGSDYQKGLTYNEVPNEAEMAIKNSGVGSNVAKRAPYRIPINQVSNTEEVPVATLRTLFRGQKKGSDDLYYNKGDGTTGSLTVGNGYYMTPNAEKANIWAGDGITPIRVQANTKDILSRNELVEKTNWANDLINDEAYMADLWEKDPDTADFIENLSTGRLPEVSKYLDKPFIQPDSGQGEELAETIFFPDTRPELTEEIRASLKGNSPKTQKSKVELSPQQQEFFKDSAVRDENGDLIPMYHGTRGDFTVFGEKNPSGSSNSKSGVGFWFTPSEEGAKNFASSIWYGDGEPKAMKTYLNIKNPKVYESIDNSKAVESLRKKLDKIELKSKTMSKPKLYYKNMYDYSVAYNMVNQGDKDMAIKWLAGKSSYDEKTATELIEEIDNMKMLEDEKKRIQDEISELKYGDAYERFRTDIYKVDGQTAEDANVGGIGMALKNDSSVQKYVDNLKAQGYDGIIIKGTNYDSDTMGGINDQYVAFDPEQIKLVDNRKPTKHIDIRYAIAAGLGLGSILGPYMNSKKDVDNVK